MRQLGAEKLSARESNMHTNQQLSPQRLNRTLGTILGFIFVFAVLLLVILNPDRWREFILDIAVSFAIQTVIASCVFSLLLLLALAAFKRFLRSFVTLHTRMLIMFFAAVLALFALTILFRRRVDVYDVIQTAGLLFLFYVLANPHHAFMAPTRITSNIANLSFLIRIARKRRRLPKSSCDNYGRSGQSTPTHRT